MKKKFLVLALCFTLVFGSLNFRKSYADGGLISLPMLGVVSSLAVGAGIVINGNDDLYDIGKIFYDWVDKHNDLTWSTVQAVFASSVSFNPSKLVSVESEFLDIIKDFFDDTFNSEYVDDNTVIAIDGLPLYPNKVVVGKGTTYVFNGITIWVESLSYDNKKVWIDENNGGKISTPTHLDYTELFIKGNYAYYTAFGVHKILCSVSSAAVHSFPYNGGYTWDYLGDKKENDSISLPVPGDLGTLVGQNKDTFWDNTDNLVGQGGLTLPGVDYPSIGVDSSVNTFPGVDSPDTDIPGVDSPSVPNEGIWATIKDFIISLVVPNDTFWTDTWGGLYNNFTVSFPMVDMDGFNDLVTGAKKFPNIDINIMGVTGRVVNGDVINSIVDWLRPIIAGFMMLCLMLFNYRKIYKLIRNTEPFGGIAPGTSDFRTGISEYKHDYVTPTGLSMPYEDFLEHAKTQRKWEMANPGQDYGKAGFTKVY